MRIIDRLLPQSTKVRSNAGFTLTEILVALTLLGIIGTFVTGKIFEQLEEGKKQSTMIQMQSLAERLKEFRRHCNFYPTSDQGLDALISKPAGGRECRRYAPGGYIDNDQVPVDPWDQEFVYESDGKTFTLYSLGPDEEEGSDDDIHLNKKKQ